ncbi:MAG: phosphoglycolate phosphatase [Candidatus Scalindua sp.]
MAFLKMQLNKIVYVGNELEADTQAVKDAVLIGAWLNRDNKIVDPRVPTIHSLIKVW